MTTNIHLVFAGTCREAFAFYEKTFNSKIAVTMTFADAPPGAPVPPDSKDEVMHTAMPLGSITLMGCDTPKAWAKPMGGFQVAVTVPEEEEVRRLYAALSEGGSVEMPLAPTFWTPLFGMCTDKYGVAWMVGVPGPQM